MTEPVLSLLGCLTQRSLDSIEIFCPSFISALTSSVDTGLLIDSTASALVAAVVSVMFAYIKYYVQ